MVKEYTVCRTKELQPGEKRIVEVDGQSVGVFNIDGEFFAIRNLCPHHFAPLCEGSITSTIKPADEVGVYEETDEGRIIQCPWHKWEFDIRTGESVYSPHKLKTRTYETGIESQACSVNQPDEECIDESQDGEPPVNTFETKIEQDMVVVYI